jgi:hypothetical protein
MRLISRSLVFCALIGLAGCGSDISRSFGLTRDTPDEFVVTKRAPLSMPPSYMLVTPQPGASRPQELTPRNAAMAALSPQSALAAQASGSPGQQALLQAAGPAAPADIRAQVDAQATIDNKPPGWTDKLMFWMKPAVPGVVVDPAKEAQRLKENAALGQANQDSPTNIIVPKKTSIFGF